jgi:hypothetical protein
MSHEDRMCTILTFAHLHSISSYAILITWHNLLLHRIIKNLEQHQGSHVRHHHHWITKISEGFLEIDLAEPCRKLGSMGMTAIKHCMPLLLFH